MSGDLARYGWQSDFPDFRSTPYPEIQDRLRLFVRDASPEQIRAWRDSIPPLQREVEEVLVRDALAGSYSAILEYELPLEARRPDVLLLVGDGVLVVELKGKLEPSQADIDQAAAYARDLRCYHRECWNRPVVPVLVPTRARGYVRQVAGVHVAGPDAVDALVAQLTGSQPGTPIDRARFLAESAYCPLPTLVESARELFNSGELRTIHRARAATDPAVETITHVVHEAAASKTRHLGWKGQLVLLRPRLEAGGRAGGARVARTRSHRQIAWVARAFSTRMGLLAQTVAPFGVQNDVAQVRASWR